MKTTLSAIANTIQVIINLSVLWFMLKRKSVLVK